MVLGKIVLKLTSAVLVLCAFWTGAAFDADSVRGQVVGGGAPIAKSTVTLFAATAGAPKQLAQTQTDNDGRFEVRTTGAPTDSTLYLVAAAVFRLPTKRVATIPPSHY